MKTQYLNSWQVRGLCKLGDVIIPGDEKLPKFSNTCFVFSADKMLKYLPKDDLAGLKLLLFVFAFTPKILILILLHIIEKRDRFPAPMALPLKMLNVGLKGVVFTLYYSKLDDIHNWGNKIMETLNYETKIIPPPELQNNSKTNDAKLIFANAKKAEVSISALSIEERLSYVERVKAVILNSYDSIIDQVQKETRKSRTDALVSEIFSVIDYCDFLIKESKNALSDKKVKTPLMLMGKKSLMYFEPVGTVLVISPWNYPFFQAIVPLMTSFVCGNANIYKPSEFTPLTGLVEKILSSAGFTNHWIQIVYGDGKLGSNLIEQRPDKIFFTGSVATGKKIMEQASKLLIPVELELGGKDAAIVFDDANIERSTSGVLWGALTNLGQSCTSVERIYVHEKIFESFKKLLIEKTQELIQSVDHDGNSDIGHMTTEQQCFIIKNQLDDALSKGAVLHTGKNWDGKSLNIPPMVLTHIKPNMKIYQEESFGPILPLISFSQEEEVVQDANNSAYGLSASVWSQDLERCQRVARKLKVGNVSINNVMLTEGNPYLPFGGVKDSGIGRYKGIVGFQTFCNIKSVLIDKNSAKIEANWFPYTLKKYKYFETLTKTAFKKDPWSFIVFALTGIQLESHSQKTKRVK
jgi:acyl-CoA reductase-like NAD-dependent aldehyde dehydrogenase